jgi:hypothetical protein
MQDMNYFVALYALFDSRHSIRFPNSAFPTRLKSEADSSELHDANRSVIVERPNLQRNERNRDHWQLLSTPRFAVKLFLALVVPVLPLFW